MLHRRDGAMFPTDVMLGIEAKEFDLGFIRPTNLVSHGLRVFRCLLTNSKQAVVPFTVEWLPSGHSNHKGLIWWSAAEMLPFWNVLLSLALC